MLVDDDTKNTRTVTKTLSTLHYPVVATHTTTSVGPRTLSADNVTRQRDRHPNHPLRCQQGGLLRIDFPVSSRPTSTSPSSTTTEPEQMVAGEDAEFLNHLLLKATYIVRKPLNRTTMAQLWRVVAWRRCCLEERIPASDAMHIAAHAVAGGKDDDDDDVVVIEEPQVHFKAVRSRGRWKRQLTINVDDGSSGGADVNPRKKIEHMNDVKGPVGQHIARHLQLPPPQEYCTKQQKDLDERRLLPSDSLFLKAILPTLNVSPCNSLILTGGAGPSCIPTTTIAGGSTAAPFQVSVFQQQQQQQPAGTAQHDGAGTYTGNAVISFNNAGSPAATGNAVISFNNVAAPAPVQAPPMGQRLSGGVQPEAPQQRLYMGPFSYQGPPPPIMRNHIDVVPVTSTPHVGMTTNKGKAPTIELPFGLPVDDFLVGQTAYGGAGPSIGAPDDDDAAAYAAVNNNAATCSLMAPPIEPAFTITEPIVGNLQGEGVVPVVVTNAVAAAEAEAPNNAEPFMMPDQVVADAPVDAEEDNMFSLESLLGLDDDMILPMEDAGAADAAGGDADGGSLNIEEGGMEIGWDLDLDDILMNNTNEFAFLDDLAWIE
uniref:Uncharacterized protein n=1 Tax=Oryza punctata TaxID=4537 RepID=A0A0E0LVL0_ORYPU